MEELLASRRTAKEPAKVIDPEEQAGLPPKETSLGVDSPATDGVDPPRTNGVDSPGTDVAPTVVHKPELGEHVSIIGPRPSGKFLSSAVLFWQFKRFFFRGVDKDIVSLQGKRNILACDLELMHAHAPHFNNKAEYMYSFLQPMTDATASFTHGANDVSKVSF
jgi:phosphate/sulfate permease